MGEGQVRAGEQGRGDRDERDQAEGEVREIIRRAEERLPEEPRRAGSAAQGSEVERLAEQQQVEDRYEERHEDRLRITTDPEELATRQGRKLAEHQRRPRSCSCRIRTAHSVAPASSSRNARPVNSRNTSSRL